MPAKTTKEEDVKKVRGEKSSAMTKKEGADEETEEAKKQKKQKSDEHKTEKAAKVKTRNIPIGCSDDSRNSIYLAVARARRPELITSL